jgi:molybdopterin-guanine dinucleotide biosynthesis protein MobB
LQIMAVVGIKKAGKTTTIEILIRELSNRGYGVAAIKHIPEPDFSVDTPGKDTWRYAQAGARTIVSVAEHEIATIERINKKPSLMKLVKKCSGNDVVFIEGLKKTVQQTRKIPKIAVTKSKSEAENALKNYNPIIAFTGPYDTFELKLSIPYANARTDAKKLADIIERFTNKP